MFTRGSRFGCEADRKKSAEIPKQYAETSYQRPLSKTPPAKTPPYQGAGVYAAKLNLPAWGKLGLPI
ncbi:hypothetical protein F4Z99_12555 [Candidatus Poribacteria bacterium]|nr:hypothetical protein [Candidatus Poribacteria bacterium]MYA99708.1 hypothetical protein [Candidatus Poribacteria bacterium]